MRISLPVPMSETATQEYEVRPAETGDIAVLPEIERAAGLLFNAYVHDLGLTDAIYAQANSLGTFDEARQAQRLWVATSATGQVVAFALVLEIGGCAHIEELDVFTFAWSSRCG